MTPSRIVPLACLLFAALGAPAAAQDKPPAKLELTPPATVEYRPGKLLTVSAKGAARVAWEVLTVPPAELDYAPQGATLLLPMPPPGTVVWVFAAAVVGDTPVIAKTTVTVKGDRVQASAQAAEKPVTGRVKNATLVLDGADVPAALAALRDSQALRAGCAARGVKLRDVDVRDESVRELGFDGFYKQAGGPCLVLQDADGDVLPGGQVFRLRPGEDLAAAVKELFDAIDTVNRQ